MTELVTLVVLALLVMLLARGVGWWPHRDRALDARLSAYPGGRNVLLAGLAAGTTMDVLWIYGGLSAEGLVALVVLGSSYRWRPEWFGPALGVAGAAAAAAGAFRPVCTDAAAERAWTIVALTLAGVAMMGFARLGARMTLLGPSASRSDLVLAVFGAVALGGFVGGPFGVDLSSLLGVGQGFTAVVVTYLLICGAAALLPAFTNSIIGAALLVAHLTVDTIVGDVCELRRFTVLGAAVVFMLAWGASGLLRRRS